jgi:hypothetical protein
MANVSTSTGTNPILYPGHTRIDVNTRDNSGWVLVFNASTNIELYRATGPSFASWTLTSTLVRAALQDASMFFAPGKGIIHVTYRTNESSQDRVYWRRYSSITNAWGPEVLLSAAANGGVAGAIYTGLDVTAVQYSWNDEEFVAVAAGTTVGASHGISLLGGYYSGNGQRAAHDIFISNRLFINTGSGRVGPSLDIQHSGDGKTASTPHLWCSYGRTRVNLIKCGWNGKGWSTPPGGYTMVSSVPAQNSMRGAFDGRRHLTATANPSILDTVAVYERHVSHTGTAVKRTSAAHPTGNVRSCTVTYDYASDDFRVYAVGTSTPDLYHTTYDRSAGTWSAWVVVTATDVLGATPENYSARRSAAFTARFDVVVAHAATTVAHYQTTQSYTPGAPTWLTASGVADVAATLLLDWQYNNQDPADAQTAYALRKQEGAGAFEYWRASDSTWQATEQKNLTATTAVTLPTAWGVNADLTHSYSVKTWSGADVASVYSAVIQIVPSALVNPTITAPTAAQVLTSDTVTATWTVSEQTAYRARLFKSGIVVSDTGYITSTALLHEFDYQLIDNSSWSIQINTKNLEGLPSTTIQVAFTTNFVEPAMPTLTLTPMAGIGAIRAVFANPAPVGAEPAVLAQDLYRRATVAPLNTNPYATTNTTGWTLEGTTATSLTRSTAQFHEGPASFLITCNGTAGTAAALHDTFIPVTGGALYTAGAWIFAPVAAGNVSIGVNWFDDVGASAGTVPTGYAIPAGRWTYVVNPAPAPANAVTAKPRMRVGGTPINGFLVYFDEIRFDLDTAVDDMVRVAAGLSENATVDDKTTASGVSYEYRALVRGVNGTTFWGPWMI